MTTLGLLQTALYTALTGDVTLMGKINGVYDWVYGEDYPYIIIGDSEESTWETLGRSSSVTQAEGYRTDATIFIVTDNTGYKESLDITIEVERVLYAGISISGYSAVLDSMRRATRRDDTNGVRYVQLVVTYLIKKT
jgi:hypothetical protein